MTIDFESMVPNERRKVIMLLQTALELDISIDEYVEIGVNNSTGNVWLMHYDYNFVLYIGLHSDDVWVQTTDNLTGEEYERPLNDFPMDSETIEAWAEKEVS